MIGCKAVQFGQAQSSLSQACKACCLTAGIKVLTSPIFIPPDNSQSLDKPPAHPNKNMTVKFNKKQTIDLFG